MSIYAWCEDSGSGFEFWKEIFHTLYPNIIVETKLNNSQLRKAAEDIEDGENEYYILMDSFIDNQDVLRELDRLKRCVKEKKNIHIIDIRSFEFALLSFKPLVRWVFDEQNKLKSKRKNLIRARELFIEQVVHSSDIENLNELEEIFPYAKTHNGEQTASELLYQITRNTGFETDKGTLGRCFVVSCCEQSLRRSDNLCGLNSSQITADKKKKQLVNDSILKSAFERVGL